MAGETQAALEVRAKVYELFGTSKFTSVDDLEARAREKFSVRFVKSPLFWRNSSVRLVPSAHQFTNLMDICWSSLLIYNLCIR